MSYVHGYSSVESQRLLEQAVILDNLLHFDTIYEKGTEVLEPGCGVGGQTRILSRRNPEANFTCFDISEESIEEAKGQAKAAGVKNAKFQVADINSLSYEPESFDHIFLCFVLEHMPDPAKTLKILMDLLKPGGSFTVIEGDHGSAFWNPESPESIKSWKGLVKSQQELGHDPHIGRRLYPLLKKTGLKDLEVTPRSVYADHSNPSLLEGVIGQIIAPMVFSAGKQVLESGLSDRKEWQKGLDEFAYIARNPIGTFYYSWFKGVGIKK